MFKSRFHRVTRVLLLAGLMALLPAVAAAEQGTHRTTSELKKDLRATEREYKAFKSLRSKLESAAKQSSNASRKTALSNIQDFMGDCISRREKDLGEEMTIVQHGESVKSGTTDVAEVGAPVPGKRGAKGLGVYGTSNGDRVRQLSHMKSIYVSAKNNMLPATERQTGALERYFETFDKFGGQLEWGINGLNAELAKREEEKQAKADKDAAALEEDTSDQ